MHLSDAGWDEAGDERATRVEREREVGAAVAGGATAARGQLGVQLRVERRDAPAVIEVVAAAAARVTERAPGGRVGGEPTDGRGQRLGIAGGTTIPASPSSSATPPTSVARTGAPHAIASSTVTGKHSARLGWTKMSQRRNCPASSPVEKGPA